MFYLLVAGSRSYNDYEEMKSITDKLLSRQNEVCIVSGGAYGADKLAEKYAKEKGYDFIEFKAEWEKYGKSAGYKRNKKMHEFISSKENRGIICFWDEKSKGTKQNFDLAKKYENKLKIFSIKSKKFLQI